MCIIRGMRNIVEIIHGLRQAGLTQAEIGKRTGVPQCRISRWGKGDVAQAANDALKLAELEREIAESPPDQADASAVRSSDAINSDSATATHSPVGA